MSKAIETKLDALTAAITALVAASAPKLASAPVAPVAPAPVTRKAKKAARVYAKTCTVQRNIERDGIELVFGGPIEKTLSAFLLGKGFKFAPSTRRWYVKGYSPAREMEANALAHAINNGQIA